MNQIESIGLRDVENPPARNGGIFSKNEAVFVGLTIGDEDGLKLIQNCTGSSIHQPQRAQVVRLSEVVALKKVK